MRAINHVLAVVPVGDFEAAKSWYERLLGRPADNLPMPGLADWRLTDTGWVQVFRDTDRAGSTMLNLAVDHLDELVTELANRGLTPGPVQEASGAVRLSTINDPDGNTITFIENLRTAG